MNMLRLRPMVRGLKLRVFLTTLLALLLLGFIPSLVQATPARTALSLNANWSMLGYDVNHTYFNPAEHTLNMGNVSDLEVAWKFGTGNGIGSIAPAIVNGIAYFGSANHTFYAVRASTGTLLWQYAAGGPIYSSPAVAGGVVYFGTRDGAVYALNAQTGAFLWRAFISGAISWGPTVVNQVVYIAGSQTIYALDASTGSVIWTYFVIAHHVASGPTVVGGIVYVSAFDLLALDAGTGQLIWRFTPEGSDFLPTVVNGIVYVSSDGVVLALSASTGQVIWSFATNSVWIDAVAVANGVVYVGSEAGVPNNVFALGAQTGAMRWMSALDPAFISGLSIANGVIYVTGLAQGHGAPDYGFLAAFDAATGTTLLNKGLNALPNLPVVVNGTVYFTLDDGSFYALSVFDEPPPPCQRICV